MRLLLIAFAVALLSGAGWYAMRPVEKSEPLLCPRGQRAQVVGSGYESKKDYIIAYECERVKP